MKNVNDSLRDLLNVQGSDGNWNADPYMHGMYNGMEMALAIFENREPVFKSAPDVWLCDNPRPEDAPVSST